MKKNTQILYASKYFLIVWFSSLLVVFFLLPAKGNAFEYILNNSFRPIEICNNNIDDDGDGFTDCADADCDVRLNCPIPTNCTVNEGTISFDNIGENDASNYSTKYLLTDSLNTIQQVSNTTTFNNVLEGGYIIYSLNYESAEMITGIQPGDTIKNITGNCFDIKMGSAIRVCKLEEICNNGIDDDGDGFIDCSDSDCEVMTNCPIPVNCTVNEGRIVFESIGGNIAPNYSGKYLLTNAQNIIVQISDTSSFVNVMAGGYIIYFLNYESSEIITGIQIGNNIEQVTGNCFEVSGGNPIRVCKNDVLLTAIFSSCPGLEINENLVNINSISEAFTTNIISPPLYGVATVKPGGAFSYIPNTSFCGVDSFHFELIFTSSGLKDTSTIIVQFTDNVTPTLSNVPPNDTLSCDDERPIVPRVSAIDNCPAISIDVSEVSTQGEDGCSLYDYTLTRTWTAKDACGNSTDSVQVVKLEDNTAPDIFRIYTLPNGKKMVAGVMENVTHRWKTIRLPIDFDSKPLIFSQIITTNEVTPATTRQRNISTRQFELRLQEEEGEDGQHARESVAWIAIEAGNQNMDYPLETRLLNLTDTWQTTIFQESYTPFPSFFTAMQTTEDIDPATIRFDLTNLSSIDLRIEEEASSDIDISHAVEQVAFLGINPNINLTDEGGNTFGETGSVSVGSNWITVATKNQYYNPVVIAGTPQSNEAEPGVALIRNVTPDSFQIKFQEWNYLDGNHALEYISYLVVEGSLPLDATIMCETGNDGLTLGKDIVAIDNCDISVSLNYQDSVFFEGANRIIRRDWSATDECGNATSLTQDVICTGVAIQLKTFLQGAMIGSKELGLMRDDLRKKGLIPIQEPYSDIIAFRHVGEGGGETLDTALLSITGAKAIVDWVFLELRASENQNHVVATYAGLIQRDGNIITAKGDSLIAFYDIPPQDYYVAIRHRNHLGVQSLDTYSLNNFQVPFLDFSNQFMPTRGWHALIESNQQKSIWAGDLNNDGKIIYQGPQNEIFYIFLTVLLDNNNLDGLSNFISAGYSTSDFNLDGVTIYQGPNNDRAMLLYNTILRHPENSTNFPNFIIQLKDDDP